MQNEKQTHLEQALQTQGALSREHCCSALEDRIHPDQNAQSGVRGCVRSDVLPPSFKNSLF